MPYFLAAFFLSAPIFCPPQITRPLLPVSWVHSRPWSLTPCKISGYPLIHITQSHPLSRPASGHTTSPLLCPRSLSAGSSILPNNHGVHLGVLQLPPEFSSTNTPWTQSQIFMNVVWGFFSPPFSILSFHCTASSHYGMQVQPRRRRKKKERTHSPRWSTCMPHDQWTALQPHCPAGILSKLKRPANAFCSVYHLRDAPRHRVCVKGNSPQCNAVSTKSHKNTQFQYVHEQNRPSGRAFTPLSPPPYTDLLT